MFSSDHIPGLTFTFLLKVVEVTFLQLESYDDRISSTNGADSACYFIPRKSAAFVLGVIVLL